MLSLIIREFDGEKIEFSGWIMSVSEKLLIEEKKVGTEDSFHIVLIVIYESMSVRRFVGSKSCLSGRKFSVLTIGHVI